MDIELAKEEEFSGKCPLCGSDLEYDGLGSYVCTQCGVQEMDDYGKVRAYLDKYGMTRLSEISEATDVPLEKIQEFIDEGKFEVVVHCAGCGIEIKEGMYCVSCRRKTLSELNQAMSGAWEKQKGRGVHISQDTAIKAAGMRYVNTKPKE